MAEKSEKRRVLINIPRPTRRTLQILGLGVAAVVAVYFALLAPARAKLSDTEQTLERQQVQLTRIKADLELYRTGKVLDGERLKEAVVDTETLLPNLNLSPAETFSLLSDAAKEKGLIAGDTQLAATYQPIGDAQDKDASESLQIAAAGIKSTTLAVSIGSMRVVGDLPDILAWLEEIDRSAQLVTYTTSGFSEDPNGYSMTVQLYVWASTQSEWQNGKPLSENAPAVPAQTGSTTTTVAGTGPTTLTLP